MRKEIIVGMKDRVGVNVNGEKKIIEQTNERDGKEIWKK
jgi:hypothetical protein